MPSLFPRFNARRSAAFGANGLQSAARNRFDSASESVATDSAATVLSASRNTAVRTNAASGNPANAAARSIRSRSFVDRRRSRRAAALMEKLPTGNSVRYYTVLPRLLRKVSLANQRESRAALMPDNVL